MKLRLPLLPAAVLVAAGASAQTHVETFEGSSNEGGWTFGVPVCEQILPSGGNPGAHLDEDCLDTFAPQPRTSDPGSVFCGDWRARHVTGFGIDLITNAVQGPFLREATLVLTNGKRTVYQLGTDFVPQIGAGWKAFDWVVPAQSPTLPAGWAVIDSQGNDDADWNAVISDVQEVSVFYGDPTGFFVFDIWEIGIDNPRLTLEPVGASYCSTNPNSTGLPASIVAGGSAQVADGALELFAADLPANQFGYFLVADAQGFVANPGGSQGNLCLAGSIGRYAQQAASSGPDGVLTLSVDLQALPTSPPVAVQPGETWSFQAWFRDKNPGATSNLTDGVAVTFQ